MSRNIVDKSTGELVTTASGSRIWIGTKSAHDLAVQHGTMPNNCMVCITDDYGEESINTIWKFSHTYDSAVTTATISFSNIPEMFHCGKLYVHSNSIAQGTTDISFMRSTISATVTLNTGTVIGRNITGITSSNSGGTTITITFSQGVTEVECVIAGGPFDFGEPATIIWS